MNESIKKITAIVEKLEDDFSNLNFQNTNVLEQLNLTAESIIMSLNVTKYAPHNEDYSNIYDDLQQRVIAVQNKLNKQ